jgi:hypothetical protein
VNTASLPLTSFLVFFFQRFVSKVISSSFAAYFFHGFFPLIFWETIYISRSHQCTFTHAHAPLTSHVGTLAHMHRTTLRVPLADGARGARFHQHRRERPPCLSALHAHGAGGGESDHHYTLATLSMATLPATPLEHHSNTTTASRKHHINTTATPRLHHGNTTLTPL